MLLTYYYISYYTFHNSYHLNSDCVPWPRMEGLPMQPTVPALNSSSVTRYTGAVEPKELLAVRFVI